MVRLGRPAGDRLPPPSTRAARSPLALSLALHGLIGLPLLAAGSAGSASTEQPALLVDIALVSSASASTSTAAAGTDASAEEPAPPAEPMARTPVPPAIPLPPPDTSAMTIERPTMPIEREARTIDREARIDLPPPEEPPPLDTATQKMEREIKIDLAPAEEPPPFDTSTLKPVEPPKPKPAPAPKPAPPAQAARVETPRPVAPNSAGPSPAGKPAAPARAASSSFSSASNSQQAAAGFLPAPAIVWEGKPRFRHPPTPAVYPARAIELAQQGEALVRVRLDTNGTAVEIVLHRSSGHHSLDSAALAAVRSWHFLPAMRDGRPVPSWVEIPVRFHLR